MRRKKPEIATGVIIKNDKNQIFLAKSLKYGGLWIVPGGHLEYGETLEDCIRREIREELSIELSELFPFSIQEAIKPLSHQKDPKKHFVFVNFVARMQDFRSEIILCRDEFSEYCFINPKEALKKLKLNLSTKNLVFSYINKRKREMIDGFSIFNLLL